MVVEVTLERAFLRVFSLANNFPTIATHSLSFLNKMCDNPDLPHPQSLVWGCASHPQLHALHSNKVKFVMVQSRLRGTPEGRGFESR
jgi:hypothetical protein